MGEPGDTWTLKLPMAVDGSGAHMFQWHAGRDQITVANEVEQELGLERFDPPEVGLRHSARTATPHAKRLLPVVERDADRSHHRRHARAGSL